MDEKKKNLWRRLIESDADKVKRFLEEAEEAQRLGEVDTVNEKTLKAQKIYTNIDLVDLKISGRLYNLLDYLSTNYRK